MFAGYRGSAVVNGSNVTVTARYTGGGYSVVVLVDGSWAYSVATGLPATIAFSYGGVGYRLNLTVPEPPVLNTSLQPELEPADSVTIPLPNGSVVDVTVYSANKTVKVGNATVVVASYASRIGLDVEVLVFGVSLAGYNVSVAGLDAGLEASYTGAHSYTLRGATGPNRPPTANTRGNTSQDNNTATKPNNNHPHRGVE